MQKQRKTKLNRQQKPKQDIHPVTPAPVTKNETIDKTATVQTKTPKMKWNGDAWRKAAIKRQLNRGVFEFDRIVEYTGIPADKALPIYIELQPDPQ